MIDVKRAVSEKRTVRFTHYHDGNLWYETAFGEPFPVPVADVGNASFLVEDKAILFMRYMRMFNETKDGAAIVR